MGGGCRASPRDLTDRTDPPGSDRPPPGAWGDPCTGHLGPFSGGVALDGSTGGEKRMGGRPGLFGRWGHSFRGGFIKAFSRRPGAPCDFCEEGVKAVRRRNLFDLSRAPVGTIVHSWR